MTQTDTNQTETSEQQTKEPKYPITPPLDLSTPIAKADKNIISQILTSGQKPEIQEAGQQTKYSHHNILFTISYLQKINKPITTRRIIKTLQSNNISYNFQDVKTFFRRLKTHTTLSNPIYFNPRDEELTELLTISPLVKMIFTSNEKEISLRMKSKNTEKNKETVDDLIENIGKLGEITGLEKSVINGHYSISLTLPQNKILSDLLEQLKTKIEDVNSIEKTYFSLLENKNHFPSSRYLGTWKAKNPTILMKVEKDMRKLYQVLEETLLYSPEEKPITLIKRISSDKKDTNTTFGRGMLMLYLMKKYNIKPTSDIEKLSTPEIGKIVGGKDHSTVIVNMGRFNSIDYNLKDPIAFFEQARITYKKRAPKLIKNK